MHRERYNNVVLVVNTSQTVKSGHDVAAVPIDMSAFDWPGLLL